MKIAKLLSLGIALPGAVVNNIIVGIIVAFLGFRAAIAPWRITDGY